MICGAKALRYFFEELSSTCGENKIVAMLGKQICGRFANALRTASNENGGSHKILEE
jgi:hypothetical protein